VIRLTNFGRIHDFYSRGSLNVRAALAQHLVYEAKVIRDAMHDTCRMLFIEFMTGTPLLDVMSKSESSTVALFKGLLPTAFTKINFEFGVVTRYSNFKSRKS
jgi:hypothetical protein